MSGTHAKYGITRRTAYAQEKRLYKLQNDDDGQNLGAGLIGAAAYDRIINSGQGPVNEILPDSFLSALNCAMSHSENPTIPVRRTTIVIKTNRALFKQRYAFVPSITEVFKMQ